MKNIRFLFASFIFVYFCGNANVFAQDRTTESRRIVLPAGQTIDRDYFAVGDVVEINGTVNGDLYVAGGEVTVAGTINGDVLAVGGSIRVTGTVNQDVRAAGGNITITGRINRNITVGAGNLNIGGPAELRGSLVAGAGNVYLGARLNGDATVGAGSFEIDNRIDGDVNTAVEQLSFTPRALINGDLSITSNQPVDINESQVRGSVSRNIIEGAPDRGTEEDWRNLFSGLTLLSRAAWFLTALLAGILLLNVFPFYFERAVTNLRTRPAYNLLIGLLFLLITPFVILLLLATILGIPLALILLALYLILLYFAPLPVVYWLGSEISKRMGRSDQRIWNLVVGLIIYTLILFIPVISALVKLVFTLLGIGAMITALSRVSDSSRVPSDSPVPNNMEP